MKILVTHIILTIIGGFLFFTNTGVQPTALNGILVFSALFVLLWSSSIAYKRSYFRKLPKAISLLLYFLKEFIVANLRIAHDILSRKYYMQPTLVALPLDVRSDFEITLLASVISLTPGSLSLDLSPDHRVLYLHALYMPKGGIEEYKLGLKQGFERRIIDLMA